MFEIASQLRLNHQKMYDPKDGLLVRDINNLWQQMEHEEHAREVALREELIRQQQLEELASRFDRKANMREGWLNENYKLLSVDNFGEDLPAVEAAVKKHEAIETDIKVRLLFDSGCFFLREICNMISRYAFCSILGVSFYEKFAT